MATAGYWGLAETMEITSKLSKRIRCLSTQTQESLICYYFGEWGAASAKPVRN